MCAYCKWSFPSTFLKFRSGNSFFLKTENVFCSAVFLKKKSYAPAFFHLFPVIGIFFADFDIERLYPLASQATLHNHPIDIPNAAKINYHPLFTGTGRGPREGRIQLRLRMSDARGIVHPYRRVRPSLFGRVDLDLVLFWITRAILPTSLVLGLGARSSTWRRVLILRIMSSEDEWGTKR